MQLQEYKVWDRTTRLFHWINLLCVLALIALGTTILNDNALGVSNDGKILLKSVHVSVGYVFVVNLFWRLIWGFIGGPYARWSNILPVGREYYIRLRDELNALNKGEKANYIGLTPLGRMMIAVIMLALVVQAGTGLFLAGTDLYWPPFGRAMAEKVAAPGLSPDQVRPYAPETTSPGPYKELRAVRSPVVTTHETTYYILLGLIFLHVLAVVAKELLHGGNLVSAMFTGKKVFAIPPRDPPLR